jgi:hypothetical protein
MTTFLKESWAVTRISDQLPMNVGSPRYGNSDGKDEAMESDSFLDGRLPPIAISASATPDACAIAIYGHLWSSDGHLMVIYGRSRWRSPSFTFCHHHPFDIEPSNPCPAILPKRLP